MQHTPYLHTMGLRKLSAEQEKQPSRTLIQSLCCMTLPSTSDPDIRPCNSATNRLLLLVLVVVRGDLAVTNISCSSHDRHKHSPIRTCKSLCAFYTDRHARQLIYHTSSGLCACTLLFVCWLILLRYQLS